jgi:NitT/TauT family transport system substrate-binding protein
MQCKLWLFVILLISTLNLVAAGRGVARESTAVSAKTCSTLDTLTLQLKWVTQTQFAGYYAANKQGYYKEECLEVTIRPGGSDVVPEQVVASGGAQFGLDWLPSLLAFREQGALLKTIAQVFQYSGMREISWKESNIHSPADLRGKKVAVWLGGNEYELFTTLDKYHLDPKQDVEIVPQAFDMTLLLQKQVVAAAAMTYNELAQVLGAHNPATGRLYQLEELNVIDFNKEGTAMLEDGIFVKEDWLKDSNNQDIAVRFLQASFKGWIYCRDNPDDCVSFVLEQRPQLGKAHQTWQMNEINKLIWPSPNAIGLMDKQLWQQTADIALKSGVIQKPAETAAFTNEFAHKAHQGLEGLDLMGLHWQPRIVQVTEGDK